MNQLLKKSLILFLLNLFCLVGAAQETKSISATNTLILEVNYFKDKLPAPQKIGENYNSKSWAWYSLFQRIPNWQPKTGDFPTRAVKIVPYFEGDLVKVRVSVFTGEKFHDREVFVADLEIRENERKSVKELTSFGVVPFELAVVRDFPTVASLPTVVNKTTFLQISIEPNVAVLPSFKMKLLNTSNKAVSAFAFEMKSGNKWILSGMPQGQESMVLIAPNDVFEKAIPNDLEKVKSEIKQEVGVVQNLTLIISDVVFEDGSYEGNPQFAAKFGAFEIGRKLFLKKSVPIWQNAAKSEIKNSDLDKLLEQFSAIKDEVDENSLTELIKEFPMFSAKEKESLRVSALIAFKGTKQRMLGELQEFKDRPNKNAEFIQTWLTESRNIYESWLTRLNR